MLNSDKPEAVLDNSPTETNTDLTNSPSGTVDETTHNIANVVTTGSNTQPSQGPYFDSKKLKVFDFVGGMLTPIGLGIVASLLLVIVTTLSDMTADSSFIDQVFNLGLTAIPVFAFLSYILLIIYFARTHRRYMVLGLLTPLLLPLLLSGACLLVIGSL